MTNSNQTIAKAIFTVNKHAKTAPSPKELYLLKKRVLEKLLKEGRAKKMGLHFSPNPKNCQQRSDVLIALEEYFFHMPPSKEDYKTLPHLGQRNESYRNPKSDFSLKKSKEILQAYLGKEKSNFEQTKENPKHKEKKKTGVSNKSNSAFVSSYLGEF